MIEWIKKVSFFKNRSISIVLCAGKIILSMLLLSIYSIGNSPFVKGYYGYDMSYYNVIGRMINAGRIPYRDFLDVKGPVFLYWQALGQKLSSNRWGAFILECVLMTICVVLLHLIGEVVSLGHVYNLVLFAVYQYVFIKSFWGSCSVEEFTMPGNLFALYCAIRTFYSRKKNSDRVFFKPVSFFMIGLLFGVALFSKITTAAPMCVSMLFILVIFIIDKDYKQTLRVTLLIIAGIMLVVSLIIVYFTYMHNLEKMLTWVFVKAVARGVNKFTGVDGGLILLSFLMVFFVAYALIKIHKRSADLMDCFLLITSMATFIALQIGDRWSYYYLQLLPTIVLFMIIFFEDLRKVKDDDFILMEYSKKEARIGDLLMSLTCVVICVFSFSIISSKNLSEGFDCVFNKKYAYVDADFEKITSMIAPQEREEVFCLGEAICYCDASGIVPANKFPGFVSTFSYLDESVMDERLIELNSVKPLWIVGKDIEENEMDAIKNIIRNEYSLVLQNDMGYELWKRK